MQEYNGDFNIKYNLIRTCRNHSTTSLLGSPDPNSNLDW